MTPSVRSQPTASGYLSSESKGTSPQAPAAPVTPGEAEPSGWGADAKNLGRNAFDTLVTGTPDNAWKEFNQMQTYLGLDGDPQRLYKAALTNPQNVTDFTKQLNAHRRSPDIQNYEKWHTTSKAMSDQMQKLIEFALNNPSLLEKYIERGGDIGKLSDATGKSVLHVAVEQKRVDIVERLAKISAVDINVKDRLGQTPAMIASPELLGELLKSRGVDVMKGQDKKGRNILHRVIDRAQYVKAILSAKELPSDDLNALADDGLSPLHKAFEDNHIEAIHLLANDPRINFGRLSKSKDGKEGMNPLEWRISKQISDVKDFKGTSYIPMEILLHPKFNLKDHASTGQTLLDYIERNNNVDPNNRSLSCLVDQDSLSLIKVLLGPCNAEETKPENAPPAALSLDVLKREETLRVLLQHPDAKPNTKLNIGGFEGTLLDICGQMMDPSSDAKIKAKDEYFLPRYIINLTAQLIENNEVLGNKQDAKKKLIDFAQRHNKQDDAILALVRSNDLETVRDLLRDSKFDFKIAIKGNWGQQTNETLFQYMATRWLSSSDWEEAGATKNGGHSLEASIIEELLKKGAGFPDADHNGENIEGLKRLLSNSSRVTAEERQKLKAELLFQISPSSDYWVGKGYKDLPLSHHR